MMAASEADLRVAVVSDIHLGHRRNPAAEIIKNLRAAFPDNSETGQLDIIFLAGDVFDDLLSLPDGDVYEIDVWIAHFLRVCAKHGIMVRILEGTPRHDWKQSERFVTINEVADIGADLQYVKDLSIEYIERYGITVLYVPDEWENTTDKTLSQVHDLLRAKGLTQVDFAIMHGQFEYQLPAMAKAPSHSSQEYLKIVRELIFIGHVHIHTRFERIIAQGSFDRLAHGEEGPKGHVRATIRKDGTRDVVFVENQGAKQFVTVDCTGLDSEQSLEKIDHEVGLMAEGTFVRVAAQQGHPIFDNMELLIRHYPFFTWSKLVREEDSEEAELVEEETLYIPITLTRDNLPGLLMERLATGGASANVMAAARILLEEVI